MHPALIEIQMPSSYLPLSVERVDIRNRIFKDPKLTIDLDLGDRTSHYCVLDEAAEVLLEHSLPTPPNGIHQVFSRIPAQKILAGIEKLAAY